MLLKDTLKKVQLFVCKLKIKNLKTQFENTFIMKYLSKILVPELVLGTPIPKHDYGKLIL